MKVTPFTPYHIAAGAKMAEFAGYNMPIEFSGIKDEHATVRNGAGVFDVSHMGEIWILCLTTALSSMTAKFSTLACLMVRAVS